MICTPMLVACLYVYILYASMLKLGTCFKAVQEISADLTALMKTNGPYCTHMYDVSAVMDLYIIFDFVLSYQ